MAFQKVPPGNGVQWLTDAVNLILKKPTPYLLMGLVLAVISAVPVLGGLALVILGPALYGGIMYAAHENQAGREPDFQQLFQAFREEGKLGRMILLCLPLIAASIVVGVFALIFVGGALLGAGVSAATNSGAALGASLGIGGLLLFLVAVAAFGAAFALTFFATPRVMLDDAEPFAAMKDSLQACIANIGAFVLFVVIASVIGFIALFMIGLVSPTLAQLLVFPALLPVVYVGSYLASRQVYRLDITQELPPADLPPTTPPSPPPSDS